MIGDAWRTMSEGEKAKYQDKAAAAKAAWAAANPGGKKAAAGGAGGAGGGAAKAGKAGKAAAGEKVKRGPTPYIKFASAERAKVLADRPDLASNVTEVAKIMGARWRALSAEQKKVWG